MPTHRYKVPKVVRDTDLIMIEAAVSVSLHKKAKVRAIMESISLRELVRIAIERYVEAKS